MEEHIRFEPETLAEDIKKRAKEDGLTVSVYCPYVSTEKILGRDEQGLIPLVNVVGNGNEFTVAMTCICLETTLEKLKAREGVKETMAFLRAITKQNTVEIDGFEKGENND